MIKSLTSLRGIFILFIFFHHCLNIYPGGGSMAVAFFFVLGGFSMTLGYKERVLNPEFSYKQYVTRRCIKFYPLHWLCLLAVLPLAGLPLTLKQGGVFALNAALLQTFLPLRQLFFSYNAVSWYLADTLFFAVVFPPLIRMILKSTPKGRITIATLFAAVYITVAALIPSELYHYTLYISPYMRLTDFVFGIYLALGYLSIKEKHTDFNFIHNGTVSLFVIFVLIALLVVESCLLPKPIFHVAPVYWALVAAVILVASLAPLNGGGRLLENKYFQRLGELSFTIFLTHQLVLRYMTILFNKIHFENDAIYIVFSLAFTVFLSVIIENYILKPITQWLTKRIQPSMIVRS